MMEFDLKTLKVDDPHFAYAVEQVGKQMQNKLAELMRHVGVALRVDPFNALGGVATLTVSSYLGALDVAYHYEISVSFAEMIIFQSHPGMVYRYAERAALTFGRMLWLFPSAEGYSKVERKEDE